MVCAIAFGAAKRQREITTVGLGAAREIRLCSRAARIVLDVCTGRNYAVRYVCCVSGKSFGQLKALVRTEHRESIAVIQVVCYPSQHIRNGSCVPHSIGKTDGTKDTATFKPSSAIFPKPNSAHSYTLHRHHTHHPAHPRNSIQPNSILSYSPSPKNIAPFCRTPPKGKL